MKKRILSMLLAIVMVVGLLPTVALAAEEPTYELYVGGVQVTESNLSGEGWSYDPTTNTLTLNDYTYEGEGYLLEDDDGKYAAAIYYGGSDTLTIDLRGTSSVTQESDAALDLTCGIHSVGDLEIVSTDPGDPGKLTATGGKTDDGISCGVFAEDITVSGGSLTGIGGESHYVSYGVSADEINIIDGSLKGVGGDVSETTQYYSCGVFGWYGITMEGGELTGTGGTSSATSYGVVACGDITMEDGELTGEGGTATKNSYGVCARLYDYNAKDSYANITVTGGSLMGVGGTATKNSGGVYVDDNITVSGGSLTGIGGTAEKDSYGVGAYNDITVTGGRLTGEGGTAAINKVPEIDGEARVWYGESEETAVFTFAESLEDYYDDQQYVRIVLWDFYVGGTKVTSENLSGTGWSYDPTTNTLTLNDYTYEGEGYSWEDVNGKCAAAIYYGGSDTLTLDLYGTSIVTQTGDTDLDVPCGIFIVGDLEIVSTDPGNPGKLTATGDKTDKELGISCGVVAGGNITVSGGGSLTGIGKESHYVSYGVSADEISIIDGSLKGVGGDVSETTQYYSYSCGVLGWYGITMEGGELTGTGGTSSATSYGVVAYDGSITISGDGSLTGEGGTAGNYSNGVVAYYKDSITISGDGSLTGVGGTATNTSYGVYAYDITVSGGSLTGEGGTAGNNSYGVYAYKDSITISGDGSLTGKGGTANNYSRGVYAYNNITVTDGSLTGTSGTATNSSRGVYAYDITVSGGSLTGVGGEVNGESGNSNGVYAYGSISVTGGSLEGSGGAATGESGKSYGVDAYDITVSGGSLTATGGAATGESGNSYGVEVYDITVSGGSLTATGGEVDGESGNSYGVYAYNDITVTGGETIAQGGTAAINIEPTVGTWLAAYDVNNKEIKNPDYTALTYVKIYVSEESDFTDVKKGSYYYDAVNWAVAKGITSGTTATTFSPNNPCTRAQMATFLWRTAGSPDPIGSVSPFTDVPADTYYATAVQWAYEQGITGGTSTTTFSPDAPCTRAQMATFLWRYAGSPEVDHDLSHFVDADQISGYAREALEWANLNGIINGKGNGILDPGGNATRAEVAQMMMNYLMSVQ